MDFRDIFRSFFGFNVENDDNFWNKDFHRKENHFNDDFETNMSRDFEDIFRSFGHMFNQFSILNEKDFIDLNDSNKWQELEIESKNPRDLMLNQNKKNFEDYDYDERVRKNGLNSIINDKTDNSLKTFINKSPIESKFVQKSYFYSSSSNNGRTEEKKVTKDGFGNEVTSVTQKIGDKSYTQFIKKNNNNIVEQNEILSNLDENELKDFMREWNGHQIEANVKNFIPVKDKNQNSSDNSLLKRLFGFKFF